ncbi:MAG TPA: amino acid adenylation domain-containing protein, partial [Vicinamibacteria bacterium]
MAAAPRAFLHLAAAGELPEAVEEWLRDTGCPALELPRGSLPGGSPGHSAGPDDPAWVSFTSGSTGVPKGVAIEHASALNFICWGKSAFDPGLLQRTLFSTSLNFDLAVFECFVPLAVGAGVVIVDNALETGRSAPEATLINTVPSVMKTLVEAGGVPGSVRLVNLAGEPLRRELVERIFTTTQAEAVCNLYGPSETTTYSTWVRMRRGEAFAPHIGGPIANTQVYILNEKLEPAPVGVVGELYIGGAGVARGYLNRPELTAERFVPAPFGERAGQRMYKTGDLGRWLPGGKVEFLGRNDFQVKVRGFRIELGEIEAALSAHPAVREAVVVAREEGEGGKRLVAYYAGEEATSEALRVHLSAALPNYMVPAAYVRLESLPLTPNGKLDRKALPAPDAGAYASRGYEAPQGEIETALAEIWADVLKLERVGRHDNFFELGGHSLLGVRVISRLRQELSVEASISDLFEHPVLADFALALESATHSERLPITRVERSVPLPLSFAQQRLWFLTQMEGAGEAYHIPFALHLRGRLDTGALRRALDRILARHEALRTTFALIDGVPLQQIAPAEDCRFALVEHDLSGTPDPQEGLRRLAAEEAGAGFDLEAGPLIRGRLIRLAADEHALLLTVHHIVFDGWSTGVFFGELSRLYGAFLREEPDPLPAPGLQYADYAVWQRRWIEGEVLQRQAEYWK